MSANLSWITNFIWNIADDVLRDVPDAWHDLASASIGIIRYFYKSQPLRSLEEIRADIEATERDTDGMLGKILVGVGGD